MRLFTFLFIFLLFACNEEAQLPFEPVDPPASFEPRQYGIECDQEIPIDNKVDMSFIQTQGDVLIIHEGTIERRGGFSLGFPKHSYELDFLEDVSFEGLAADDDWILNANYIDKTFLRNSFSYELFRSMHPENIASHTSYIKLDLNQEEKGLYILMEKLDRSTLFVDQTIDDHALIFKEPHIFRQNYDNIIPQDPNNFHQQTFPKIEEEDKHEYIEALRDFILNSSDEVFTADFSSYFDQQNIIDWNLLLMMTNNSDGILKNFYLYKANEQSPVKIAPWDYDHSFGRDGDNELNLDERPLDITRSILFDRLLTFDWYKDAVKARWAEMNELNIMSVLGLKERIEEKSFWIQEEVEKNFELWPVSSQWYYDDNGFAAEIKIMNDFIDLRHARLMEYFEF